MLFIEGHCPHCNEKRGFNLFNVSEYRTQLSARESSTEGEAGLPAKKTPY